METTTRNATLENLATLLTEQQARKEDIVASATKLSMIDGILHIEDAHTEITMDGVTSATATYRPTAIFDEGVANKLGIPVKYLRRMRSDNLPLYDANVNSWLAQDDRKFLARCFSGDGEEGIARSLNSDSFKAFDNLDGLTAGLQGIRDSGQQVEVIGCDLSERRMVVKVQAPGIAQMAPDLLKGYRTPFGNIEGVRRAAEREGMAYEPGDEPIVFAGFILSNSETGGGAYSLTPRLVVQLCKNGLVIGEDAFRSVHVGSRLNEGGIDWSADTQRKAIDLISAKTRDAVTEILTTDYLTKSISKLEEKAGKPVEDAPATIKHVSKQLAFSDEHTKGLLQHFIAGGQPTAGGVMNAITSYSQTVESADVAHHLETQAVKAMALV